MKQLLTIFLYILPFPSFSQVLNELCASNFSLIADEQEEYDDWLEIYNPHDQQIDLGGYFLSDDPQNRFKWQFPVDQSAATSIPSKGFLLIWADGTDSQGPLHTNFKLSSQGETVYLSRSDSTLLDSIAYPSLSSDFTYGRSVDDPFKWGTCDEATPGTINTVAYSEDEKLLPPEFSLASGSFFGPVDVQLGHLTAAIHYTTDGSIPNTSSPQYSQAITLSKTTLLKAVAIENGKLPSNVVSQFYVFDETSELPVISLELDPYDLFGDSTGIFVEDKVDERRDWRKKVELNYFDNEFNHQFSAKAEISLFGNTAVFIPQKSLGVYLDKKLQYNLIPGNHTNEYNSFLLRSSSDDWYWTMIIDGVQQDMLQDHFIIDLQGYQPARVYINGSYWGIHNIRDKFNEDYLNNKYPHLDRDSVDMLFLNNYSAPARIEVLEGTPDHYEMSRNYIFDNDFRHYKHFHQASEYFNFDNAVDYFIAQSFIANGSWRHNRKVWRDNRASENGRWHWLLYDLDKGLKKSQRNVMDSLIHHDQLFKELVKNDVFLNRLIRRFSVHLSQSFQTDRVHDYIDKAAAKIDSEMGHHIGRWKDFGGISSRDKWQNELDLIYTFAELRPTQIRTDWASLFGITEYNPVTVQCFPSESGLVKDGGFPITNNELTFDLPVDHWLDLNAEQTYKDSFSHWEISGDFTLEVLPQYSSFVTQDTTLASPFGFNHSEAFNNDEAVDSIRLVQNFSIPELSKVDQTELVVRLIGDLTIFMDNDTLQLESQQDSTFVIAISAEKLSEQNQFIYDLIPGTEKTLLSTYVRCSYSKTIINFDQNLKLIPENNTEVIAHFERPELASSLFINEISAANDQVISDEFGEFDDWIELYNSSDQAINLKGLSISDDPYENNLHLFTEDLFVPANGYLLLWADGTPIQGNSHLNFKLSRKGEHISVYEPNGNQLQIVDRVQVPFQTDFRNYIRYPDGSENLRFTSVVTPAASNQINDSVPKVTQPFSIYPNPGKGNYIVLRGETDSNIPIRFYDQQGRLVQEIFVDKNANRQILPVTNLRSGFYILKIPYEKNYYAVKYIHAK